MEKLEVDEVRIALKELVLGFSNTTPNFSTFEEVKDALRHMEEIDENFHKYNLIKMIRSCLEEQLGNLIDRETELVSGEEDISDMQGNNNQKVVENITETQSYKHLFSQFSAAIEEASQELQQNFDAELLPSLFVANGDSCVAHDDINAIRHDFTGYKTMGGGSRKAEILYSACDSPMDDSSSSHDTVMFLTNDSLVEIASNLNKKNSLETRQSALKSLLMNTSVLDLPHAVWPPIRDELKDVLLNFDGSLWMQALKIVARGLTGASVSCAKEMFQILVEILMAQFGNDDDDDDDDDDDNNVDDNNVDDFSLNCADSYVDKLLRAFRLLDQYLHQLSQKHSEKNTSDALKGLMTLLSKKRSRSTHLTPFHFLSLVDPTALWFMKVMHGCNMRNLLFLLIEQHPSFLSHCVDQCLHYVSCHGNSQQTKINSAADCTNTMSFDGSQIKFFSVINCITIVTGIIRSSKGRDLFPVRRPTSVTIPQMVVTLINIILLPVPCIGLKVPLKILGRKLSFSSSFKIHSFGLLPSSSMATITPQSVAMEGLKRLCEMERESEECMCNATVMNALLQPLETFMGNNFTNQTSGEHPKPHSMTSLSRLCEVIISLTSTDTGRHHLLHGDNDKDGHPPVKILVNFVGEFMTLDSNLQSLKDQEVSLRIILSQLLAIFKQLGSSCEGFNVISKFDLHLSLKAAHALVSREIENLATPTPGSSEIKADDLFAKDKQMLLDWEATLIDSFLNLAATPKGLCLVLETGLIKDCVAHMYSRYNRKVNHREKFGYGFLTSQISSIPAGMMALLDTGFLSLLIQSIWSSLEIGVGTISPSFFSPSSPPSPSHTQMPYPKPWSLNAVDKFSIKSFTNLSSILMSFLSISKIIEGKQLPSETNLGSFVPPQSIVGLIDRLMIVDTDSKIQSLFSYEQSHLCGLRLLESIICCLDTMLLLQVQYDFLKVLLSCQRENVVIEPSKEIIIDALSLARNNILVRCYLLGGPNERIVPSRDLDLSYSNQKLPIKLFSDYPVPDCYLPKINRKYGSDTSLVPPSVKNQNGWAEFKKLVLGVLLKNQNGFKDEFVMTMLEHSVDYWLAHNNETPTSDTVNVPNSAAKKYIFSKVQLEGMNMVIRYGRHLKLLTFSIKESLERMKTVVAKISLILKKKFKLEEQNKVGFDWFLASIFLLTNGNVNRSIRFLARLSCLPLSICYWTQHLQSMTLVNDPGATDWNVGVVVCAMNHNLEAMMRSELPQVFSAFKMSGLAPGQTFQQWIRQCLLNYLDWSHIQHYLIDCVCLGPDYTTYYSLALFRHLESKIKQQMLERCLLVFLREEPITDFQPDQQLPFMQALEGKYRPIIIEDILGAIKQMKK